MVLSEVISGLEVEPATLASDPVVAGVCHDSRRVAPGDLYVGWRGERHAASSFVPSAVERGACAVLLDEPAEPCEVPWLYSPQTRRLMARIAGRVYDHPDRELVTVGVTGTNGKSTVVELLGAILRAAERRVAIFGTLGYHFDELELPGERTTPESSDLYRYLRTVRDAGADSLAMEVSSHALDQGRVDGVRFDCGVFLNLTRDHLDYHGDEESYFLAKKRLFGQLGAEGRAVVGVDDPWGRRLAEELAREGLDERLITFGETGSVHAEQVELDLRGMRGTLTTPRGVLAMTCALRGRFNLLNVLAAVAVAEALEISHEVLQRGLSGVQPVPGRLEPIDCGQEFPVVIDYAHTDAGLRSALEALRELVGDRRIVLVFGCGGDRDQGKRALMGRAAGELADLVVVTDDNPRNEDPSAIHRAILDGVRSTGCSSVRVIPDRGSAIRWALLHAQERSHAVLIAGKGHESVQIRGERVLPFRDDVQARAVLDRLMGEGAVGHNEAC